MEYKRFGDTYAVRLDRGEEILEKIKEFAQAEHIAFASVRALGAVGSFTVGVFDPVAKTYASNDFAGNFEIVSLTGTIDAMGGNVYMHIHMSAGNAKGEVFGGHLNRAVVSATCEMLVTRIRGEIDRKFDEGVGLNLWKF